MELLQLKYFCDAAQTQNFSKTAKNFLVPPSNISQSIKRLETELNTPLFDRHYNKVTLNEAGLKFLKRAKAALELLDEARDCLVDTEKEHTIKINIHINRRVVMEAVEEFRKLYPQVYFITVHNADHSSEEFDIIVTDKELKLPYLKTKAAEEKFLLAYNKNFFNFKNCSAKEMKHLPFITMGSGNSSHEATVNICNSLGFSPHIVLQSEDPFYIRKCIELGLGISIVPEFSWRGQFSDNIAFKTVGDHRRNVYIYKKYSKSEFLDKFYHMLMQKFSI